MKVFSQRGQSLVEFALVLPIILVLVMGTIDFGMLFLTKSQVEAASEAGARAAALYDGIQQNTLKDDLAGEFPNLKITDVEYPAPSGNPQSVSVTVYATYTFLTPVIEPFFGTSSITFSSTTSMVDETQS